jgi:hypothetical protein
MAGPAEEAGKVASGIVEALKSQPILLILILFNVAFIAMVHFTAKDTRERQGEMITHLLANQEKLQEMLTRCSPSGRSGVEWPNITGWPPEENKS